LHKLGPGELPINKRKGKIKAVIVPHAGYVYSGACAAWAYKEIAEAELPDVFLILGTGHSTPLTCISKDDFETPFGIVKNDTKLAALLEKKGIKDYKTSHNEEHSIEVQLPFLQFACKQNMKDIKFVPIAIGQEDPEMIADNIRDALKDYDGKVTIIISSDFTHYGTNYGYVPFVYNVKDELYNLDKKAIKFILDMDPEGFIKYCDDTGATICGRNAIAVMLMLLENKGLKASLLQYYTSGDIVGDYSNAVGYASIVIK
jgi:AmmeMemoRadiSam system protein B